MDDDMSDNAIEAASEVSTTSVGENPGDTPSGASSHARLLSLGMMAPGLMGLGALLVLGHIH
jgi:hypothetical protein